MSLNLFRRLDRYDRRIRQLERSEGEAGGGGGGDHADSDHADAFSALSHAHPGVYAPAEHDSDHDDRFSLSAHTHAVHADSDHDDRFALIEHDSAHSDAFSASGHTHGAAATPNVLVLGARATSAVDASFVQWGSDLTIPQPAGTFALDADLTARFTMGAAVTDTRMLIRLDYQTDGSTWVTSANSWSTPIPDVFQSNSATVALYVTGLTASAPVKVRVMSQRQTSTSGTATFEEGVLKVSTW